MSATRRLTLAALTLVAGTLTPGLRADDAPDPRGKPKAYKTGSGKYAIWQDAAGWHVRATAASNGQKFAGKIDAVGGEMVGLTPVDSTSGKAGKKGPPLPPLDAKSKGFTLQFTLIKGSESGFDFKLDDKVMALKFSLKVDDKDAPEAILIGAKGGRPADATFELPARPAKK